VFEGGGFEWGFEEGGWGRGVGGLELGLCHSLTGLSLPGPSRALATF
jgi:hypothetical protein